MSHQLKQHTFKKIKTRIFLFRHYSNNNGLHIKHKKEKEQQKNKEEVMIIIVMIK